MDIPSIANTKTHPKLINPIILTMIIATFVKMIPTLGLYIPTIAAVNMISHPMNTPSLPNAAATVLMVNLTKLMTCSGLLDNVAIALNVPEYPVTLQLKVAEAELELVSQII